MIPDGRLIKRENLRPDLKAQVDRFAADVAPASVDMRRVHRMCPDCGDFSLAVRLEAVTDIGTISRSELLRDPPSCLSCAASSERSRMRR